MSRLRHRALSTTLAVASTVGAGSVAAQTPTRALADDPRPGPVRGVAPKPRPNEAAVLLAPAVVVRGAPRSYQVVAVPVPSTFPEGRAATYTVYGSSAVLSSLAGRIDPGPGRPRTVLLTVAVPRQARAGDSPIATVRFAAPGAATVDVPVQLSVAPVARLDISAVETLRAARPGSRLVLAYRLTNLGNAPDTVQVQTIAPTGWRVVDVADRAPVPVGMRAVVQRTITVAVPAEAPPGRGHIQLLAVSHGRALATTEVMVDVVTAGSLAAGSGPVLTLGSSTVAAPDGSYLTGMSATVEGQLTDDVHLSARAASVPTGEHSGAYNLARGVYYAQPASLMLSSPTWRVGLGVAGATFSDLTGVSVGGRGASLAVVHPKWSASTILARPDFGNDEGGGAIAGAQVEARIGSASVHTTATHLAEDGLDDRRLDAVAAGASLPTFFDGTLGAELAARRYAGGEGMGWTTTFARRTARDNVDVRVSHAPGGSAAYARATDEWSAGAGRAMGRLTVNGNAWHTRDAGNASFSTLTSGGYVGAAQLAVTDAVGLGLQGRETSFDAASAAGAFGSRETALESSVSVRRGALYGTGSASLAEVTRTTATALVSEFDETAPHTQVRATIGTAGSYGTLELAGSLDRTGQGAGQLPRQSLMAIRADRIPLLSVGTMRVAASGEVQRYSWFGDRAAVTTLRAGVNSDLPLGFNVGLSAERNPFFASMVGGNHWVMALRVERAARLPRFGHPGTHGMVFKDLNGNGVHDRDEPGLGGVIVRQGAETAVSDANGHYTVSGSKTDGVSIDARSLPMGWVDGANGDRRRRRGELGVVALAAVQVRLAVAAVDSARVTPAVLEKVVLMAHDAEGHTWVARATGDQQVFDALPVGRYKLEVSFADVDEPLSAAGGLPEFTVVAGSATPTVVVPLRTRPVKVRVFSSSGTATDHRP